MAKKQRKARSGTRTPASKTSLDVVRRYLKEGKLAAAVSALRKKGKKKIKLPCPYDEKFELLVQNGANDPPQKIKQLLEAYYRSIYECDDPDICRLWIVIDLKLPPPGVNADFIAVIHIRCSAAPP